MLPICTYIVRFTHTDDSEIEEYEYTNESAAREHFALFGIDDADLYRRIEILEYNYTTNAERLLDTLESPA